VAPRSAYPRPQFAPHFDAARAAGLHSVPHAGETTGPETVWDALRLLGAERIGHGCTAAEDPDLLAHLAETGIALEVCPSSNLATRAVASLDGHPLRAFVDAGVTVTINSDDPPMFGTTLNREYEIAAELLSLDAVGVADLAVTAVDVSFAPEDVKTRLRRDRGVHRRCRGLTSRSALLCGDQRVVSGAIDHRDDLPTAADRDRGDTMMICVSRAACPRLVLDL